MFSDGIEREIAFDNSKNFIFLNTKTVPSVLSILHLGVFVPSNQVPSRSYDKQSLSKKFDYLREYRVSQLHPTDYLSGLWFRHLRAKPKSEESKQQMNDYTYFYIKQGVKVHMLFLKIDEYYNPDTVAQ